jgi:hypothetical protein
LSVYDGLTANCKIKELSVYESSVRYFHSSAFQRDRDRWYRWNRPSNIHINFNEGRNDDNRRYYQNIDINERNYYLRLRSKQALYLFKVYLYKMFRILTQKLLLGYNEYQFCQLIKLKIDFRCETSSTIMRLLGQKAVHVELISINLNATAEEPYTMEIRVSLNDKLKMDSRILAEPSSCYFRGALKSSADINYLITVFLLSNNDEKHCLVNTCTSDSNSNEDLNGSLTRHKNFKFKFEINRAELFLILIYFRFQMNQLTTRK